MADWKSRSYHSRRDALPVWSQPVPFRSGVDASVDPLCLKAGKIPGSMASPTDPRPISGKAGVFGSVGMALSACRLAGVAGRSRQRSGGEQVVAPRATAEVGWIAASSAPAQVIQVHPSRGISVLCFPRHAMRRAKAPRKREVPVSTARYCSGPDPAARAVARDLRPEARGETLVSEEQWGTIRVNHSVPPVPVGQDGARAEPPRLRPIIREHYA